MNLKENIEHNDIDPYNEEIWEDEIKSWRTKNIKLEINNDKNDFLKLPDDAKFISGIKFSNGCKNFMSDYNKETKIITIMGNDVIKKDYVDINYLVYE